MSEKVIDKILKMMEGKEFVLQDLNNLEVATTTSCKYETAFGFTEEKTLWQWMNIIHGLREKDRVKSWYDGSVFGERRGIYNPWYIMDYLD